jgi:hypothetical protein
VTLEFARLPIRILDPDFAAFRVTAESDVLHLPAKSAIATKSKTTDQYRGGSGKYSTPRTNVRADS